MGFFKKLVKGIGKVAKFVAPAVVAVAKTAARHTVVGQVVTTVGKVKKLTAAGAAAKAHARQNRSPAYDASTGSGGSKPAKRAAARKQPAARRKPKAKGKGGVVSAKQRAARARFVRAAKKGRIVKGTKL